jgi:dolichol-phosphate mannosyltransferase
MESERSPAGPTLAVVVPTRNEAGNIGPLVAGLEEALQGINAEIIFVDDSDDETPLEISNVARSAAIRIGLIARQPGERDGGLGGAVLAGFAATDARWIVVMDGDLQHPPELVPQLLSHAEENELDLVLASRFRERRSAGGLSRLRAFASRSLIGAARVLFPRRLKGVTDPLTGFFCVRREKLALTPLRPDGFKILLEILVRTPSLRVGECAFTFGRRMTGESKASFGELLRYWKLLMRLRAGDVVPRFGRFGLVGVTGLAVNTLALAAFTDGAGMHYLWGALAATQVSTLWNFILTDRWVFPGPHRRGRLGVRFVAYAAMNNAALLLRGPLLVVLTDWAGINLLVSNVLSLCALTVVRYAFADRVIWAPRVAIHHYDVHGLVTLTSPVALPELARFRVPELTEPALIQIVPGRLNDAPFGGDLTSTDGRDVVTYREPFEFGARYRFGDSTIVEVTGLVRRSPHVLYTNVVEPLMRWTLAEQGYALVHAACVTSGDRAFLITARTDTGKTTTILKTLDNHRGYGFVSDDLTLLGPDGTVLPYPKPLTISQHTLHAVKGSDLTFKERQKLRFQARLHSKEGRSIGLLLAEKGLPAAAMNAVVQILVPPPKYDVTRLIPGTEMTQRARLAGMVVIQRGGDDGEQMLSADVALETLMENCDDAYGFPPYPVIQNFLHSRNGADLRSAERRTTAAALSGIPSLLVTSSTMDWWQRLPRLVDETAAFHRGHDEEAVRTLEPIDD